MDFRTREGSFEEADRRYDELVRRRDAGELKADQFREQIKQIMARDDDGNWWARVGDSGEWHRREGGNWIRGNPPGYGTETAVVKAAPKPEEPRSQRRRSLPIWIPVVGLLGVAMIAVVLIGWGLLPYLGNRVQPSENAGSGQVEDAGDQEADSQVAEQPEDVFAKVIVHQATPDNTSANSTYVDDPLTNDNPDAVLIVTQNWNPGGGTGRYNDHPVGVWYDGGGSSGRSSTRIVNQCPMMRHSTWRYGETRDGIR